MRGYHLTTFGCQMNEHDSERMKGMLDSLGYEQSEERADADLILFNTCSIRESADSRFIGHLGEAKRLKSEDPTRIVGVGGCWSQSLKEKVFEQFPYVDVAFGPGQVHRLAEFLTSDNLTAQGYFEFEGFTGHLPMKRERDFQGWVQISVGCNCVCSYCIVPSTRGREVSRPAGELLAEIERLAADGVREVTLLGQNVNSYGRDLPVGEKASFAELLAMVDAIDGIDRVRYTSPHPKDMRADTFAAMAETPAVCEHLHYPLQAGSDRVLAAMHRGYTAERYLDRLAEARATVPDLAVSTDIIVGFPGETDADFEHTLEVAAAAEYDYAYTFIFSPRAGTEAAAMGAQFIDPAVAAERFARLRVVIERSALAKHEARVGRIEEVLVEGPSKRDPAVTSGRTRQNKLVHFDATGVRAGSYASVEVTRAAPHHLVGRLVEVIAGPAHKTRIPVAAG
jgi:tRNA-2-methylthio-N6-dimethylallyladenosine synthase